MFTGLKDLLMQSHLILTPPLLMLSMRLTLGLGAMSLKENSGVFHPEPRRPVLEGLNMSQLHVFFKITPVWSNGYFGATVQCNGMEHVKLPLTTPKTLLRLVSWGRYLQWV